MSPRSPAAPALSRAQIDHIAKLSSLSLTDAEASTLATELDAILRYVGELDSLDTSNVPPTTGGGSAVTTWREDLGLPGLTHEEALAAAPRTALGGFAVPAFVDPNASRGTEPVRRP
jgi:aspartyl-tRNA(Asn)/glutamyl-tRNA(Gln) amidotransferase subunit C